VYARNLHGRKLVRHAFSFRPGSNDGSSLSQANKEQFKSRLQLNKSRCCRNKNAVAIRQPYLRVVGLTIEDAASGSEVTFSGEEVTCYTGSSKRS
jgi:hypothetical protein